MRFVARGLQAQQAGLLAEAALAYRAALDLARDNPDLYNSLGLVLDGLKKHNEAIAAYRQAIALKPEFPEARFNLGLALANSGRTEEAVAAFEQVLAIRPDFAEAHYDLGNALHRLGRIDEAIARYRRAIVLKPDYASAHNNLGALLKLRGDLTEAEAAFRHVVALRPDSAEAHSNLAFVLSSLGRVNGAIASFRRAIALQSDNANAYLNLGNLLKDQGRVAEAAALYERAVELEPDLAVAHYNLGVALQHQGWMAEASERHRRALALDPDYGMARLALCMAQLPAIPATEAEITRRRDDYAAALADLRRDAAEPKARRGLAEGVGAAQPFFLAYQGRNDRALQSEYGSLVCDILRERFPPAGLAPPPRSGEPIRVGIVSGFFLNHSNWKIPIKGWLSQLDRTRFELYGYHLDHHEDDATRMAESLCQRFVRGPMPLQRWREAILADRPHVLIYPEVGMHPVAARLAAQRLAPVQCNSWGHPDTSGFPTLDYYLSSDLMEPPDADGHYTETLIRLPNLSIYYEPVEIEPVPHERAELGLRPGATVYWCCQSLYKYLPRYDEVFARIAHATEDCQFVFLENTMGRHVTIQFQERLRRAFDALGVDPKRHCVFLSPLAPAHFRGVMACCDVFLDSIGWSGCNSALESLACDLPILTMRGDLMRGRHSAAILEMMGLGDTVAEGVDDYVDRAVRLARDPAWRAELRRRTAAQKHRIWRDRACIVALEDFLEQAVRRAAAEPRAISAA